jgi:hypothetical protein
MNPTAYGDATSSTPATTNAHGPRRRTRPGMTSAGRPKIAAPARTGCLTDRSREKAYPCIAPNAPVLKVMARTCSRGVEAMVAKEPRTVVAVTATVQTKR